MTAYALYLESGPRHKKTMAHVFDLLGCVVVGPTTEEAVAAAPDAIRAYHCFMRRHGERLDAETPIETRIAEHITEGEWLGNGSPYVMFEPDFAPVTEAEIEIYLRRFRWMNETLAEWTAGQTNKQLDAEPKGGGRTARAVLLHVIGPVGSYLSAALGSAPGFSALHGAAERGELSLPDALHRITIQAEERVRATTPEERAAVRQRPKDLRTLRKALRRMLEHTWEHLAELSRRPGGPVW